MRLGDYMARLHGETPLEEIGKDKLWDDARMWAGIELGSCVSRRNLFTDRYEVKHGEFGVLSSNALRPDWEGALDTLYLMIPNNLDPALNLVQTKGASPNEEG